MCGGLWLPAEAEARLAAGTGRGDAFGVDLADVAEAATAVDAAEEEAADATGAAAGDEAAAAAAAGAASLDWLVVCFAVAAVFVAGLAPLVGRHRGRISACVSVLQADSSHGHRLRSCSRRSNLTQPRSRLKPDLLSSLPLRRSTTATLGGAMDCNHSQCRRSKLASARRADAEARNGKGCRSRTP